MLCLKQVGFMAYNTLAGGMLTGKYIDRPAAVDNSDRAKIMDALENPRGRHDEFNWGRTLYRYRTDAAQEAIVEYNNIAKSAGISLTELSLRWCRQRSMVTTSLVGHSNMKQLQESIDYFTKNDPLPEKIMWEIDVRYNISFVIEFIVKLIVVTNSCHPMIYPEGTHEE